MERAWFVRFSNARGLDIFHWWPGTLINQRVEVHAVRWSAETQTELLQSWTEQGQPHSSSHYPIGAQVRCLMLHAAPTITCIHLNISTSIHVLAWSVSPSLQILLRSRPLWCKLTTFIMSIAHLVIKDGPVLSGVPFGYQDEPVAGEIGKWSCCQVEHILVSWH